MAPEYLYSYFEPGHSDYNNACIWVMEATSKLYLEIERNGLEGIYIPKKDIKRLYIKLGEWLKKDEGKTVWQ